mmetsp:Transcript_13365/g.38488  ORF Transcript_13365/g.38488 Transcript_13365/m.38488 type:complete len:215 (-) Transcript_13365:42-686(-)
MRTRFLWKVRESVSGHGGLGDHATDGNHGKSSVLQFHQLKSLLRGLVFRVEAQRVEAEVAWLAVVVVHVGQCWECACLQEGDPCKDLDHGVREGVVGVNDIGDGREGELLAWDAEEFWDDEADGGQHGGASVLEFGLTEPWDPLWGSLRKTAWIPVDGGSLGTERDGLWTFTTDVSVDEFVQGCGLARGGGNWSKGARGGCKSGSSDQQRLHHG